jgi:hypothetical protein
MFVLSGTGVAELFVYLFGHVLCLDLFNFFAFAKKKNVKEDKTKFKV